MGKPNVEWFVRLDRDANLSGLFAESEPIVPILAQRYSVIRSNHGQRHSAQKSRFSRSIIANHDVPPGAAVHASITFDPAAGDLDLRLYDPAWSLATPTATSATSSGVEALSYMPAVPGFVVLRINGFQGASTSYALDIYFEGP